VLVPDTQTHRSRLYLRNAMLLVKVEPDKIRIKYGCTTSVFHIFPTKANGNCMFESGAFHRVVVEADDPKIVEGTLYRTIKVNDAEAEEIKRVNSAWTQTRSIREAASAMGTSQLFDESTAGNFVTHTQCHTHTVVWAYTNMHGYMWVYMSTHGCIWVHMGAYGCIWVHMGAYGCIWVYMGVYGYMSKHGYLWLGCLWLYMGVCGYMWVHVGTCGYMW
jgi:hypothetical protein